jgi:ribosomal protein L40E
LNSLEVVGAVLLAGAALWLVLQPLVRSGGVAPTPVEPLDPEETPVGVALTALKEIDFDRETGKLSSADYEQLKQKYTAAAVAAMREEQATGAEGAPDEVEAMIAARLSVRRVAKSSTTPGAPACLRCGPRPEPDAIFCSTCGGRLQAHWACGRCGASLAPDSNFCERCGSRVAA